MAYRSLQSTAALAILSSCSAHPYLPAGGVAGCYVSQGSQRLRLAPQGAIFAGGSQVGKYKVLAPVGGKHGPLVEATGLNVTSVNGRVMFASGSGGFFWDVSDQSLSVVFAPDGNVQFAKAPDAACS